MKEQKAVVLLSGGIDSAVVMAMAAKRFEKLVAVSAFYGQKHHIELGAARHVASWYNAEHRMIQLPDIFKGAGSTLMDDVEQSTVEYDELLKEPQPSPAVVPFRNSNLISAAVSVGIVEKASHVFIAAHATDAHEWAYPDCAPEFLGAMAAAVYIGSYRAMRLEFPLVWLTKAQVVEKGFMLSVPLNLTYSCYAGGEVQCGECSTCLERIKAFKTWNIIDPVPYTAEVDWNSCSSWVLWKAVDNA